MTGGTSGSIRVMVVEDEVLIGLMLIKKLRSLGFSVGELVTTGEEAVARVAREQPAVVLMDVTLAGELNGLEAARRIKREHHIPSIIFTGYDDRELDRQAREVGPVGLVAKMGPITDIVNAIMLAAGPSEFSPSG